MANHKSAKKRAKQNIERNERNKWKTSRVRTAVKKLRGLITSKNKDEASKLFPEVQSLLNKLSKDNAAHKGKTSRVTSRLASQLAKL